VVTRLRAATRFLVSANSWLPTRQGWLSVPARAASAAYLCLNPSGLYHVIDTDTPLEGKDVTQLFIGRDSYSLEMLGFLAVFSDGSRGIYLAKAIKIAKTL